MDQDETTEFETHMQNMDRRLETMRVQNELSRINTEITLLQRQIHDMEAQDAEDDASIRGITLLIQALNLGAIAFLRLKK